jgi:predicted DNA-binding transcriptional regulator YafY
MADMKRINRMVGILSMIDRGGKVTPKGLAERYGVAERTVYRDIGALVVDFPILFDEERGSYRFSEGYSLRKINLSSDEVRAVLVSKAAVAKLGKGIASAFDGLMKKLTFETGCKTGQRLHSLSPHYWLDIDPVGDCSAVQKQFDAVQKALDEKNSLEITYKSMYAQKMTKRIIDPYGLFCSKGVWYTLAYCRLKEDIREFALDCIQDTKPTDKYYTVPKTFSMDEYFKEGWHIITYGNPVEVNLWFSKDVARWIMRRKWHSSQKVTANKNGSIILKVTVNGTMELKRWLFQWGPDCEVLSPPEFRKEVAAELRSMSERYRNVAREMALTYRCQ